MPPFNSMFVLVFAVVIVLWELYLGIAKYIQLSVPSLTQGELILVVGTEFVNIFVCENNTINCATFVENPTFIPSIVISALQYNACAGNGKSCNFQASFLTKNCFKSNYNSKNYYNLDVAYHL